MRNPEPSTLICRAWHDRRHGLGAYMLAVLCYECTALPVLTAEYGCLWGFSASTDTALRLDYSRDYSQEEHILCCAAACHAVLQMSPHMLLGVCMHACEDAC
jgi:hypothetical protein